MGNRSLEQYCRHNVDGVYLQHWWWRIYGRLINKNLWSTMMTTDLPIAMEINCTTGEVIERPLTAEELADLETRRAEAEANPPVMPMSEADRLRAQLATLTARLEAAGL